jgi:hypothetical protein
MIVEKNMSQQWFIKLATVMSAPNFVEMEKEKVDLRFFCKKSRWR